MHVYMDIIERAQQGAAFGFFKQAKRDQDLGVFMDALYASLKPPSQFAHPYNAAAHHLSDHVPAALGKLAEKRRRGFEVEAFALVFSSGRRGLGARARCA